jgi:tetratricopeptide (TPR) repeat protein
MTVKRAQKLVDKGRKLLSDGEFAAAAEAFAEALEIDEAVSIRNNLAMAFFLAGEPRRALEVLEPCIGGEGEKGESNPFSYGLAARIHAALGREEPARKYLQQAVKSYEDGWAALRRLGQPDTRHFREYTVIIMRAAADMKDHRLVFDLYRRWESHHVSWENVFMAAVACFNIGRFKRAASLLTSIAGVHNLFAGMQKVAFQVERGAIPPFEMSYELSPEPDMQEALGNKDAGPEACREVAHNGFSRMAMLAWLLETNGSDEANQGLRGLVEYGGEWGEKLGRRILESPLFSTSTKMAAANALIDRGVLRENEPVSMFINEEERIVEVKRIPVITGPDKELDQIVDRAIQLRDKGQVEEATKLLQDLQQQEKLYPRAMMTLANLLRQQGEFEESLSLMKMVEDMFPDFPEVLFNFAGLMLQMGDPQRAWEYYERIDSTSCEASFKEKVKGLGQHIKQVIGSLDFMANHEAFLYEYEEQQRQKVEEKTISVNVSITRGLKNMPAIWLEGACEIFGLEPARLRRDKEKQLKDFVTRRENLKKVVEELTEEERELLRYLLQREGWSQLNAVTRKFETMEGDGFFWNEMEPESSLGNLWYRALVMVGKTSIKGRRCKIAAVPLELREDLAKLLK